MLIKEVTSPHELNKLDIKPDDLRYPLYVPAIQKYSNDSRALSNVLHQFYRNPKKVLNSKNKELAQMLDDIMFNHPIKENITVYHGLKESPLQIWLKYKVPFDQPVIVNFPAFISTSNDRFTAKKFSRSTLKGKSVPEYYRNKRNNLIINVPAGTPGLSIKTISIFPEEDEILLARGLDIKIYPNPYLTEGDFLYWRANVVGHTPQEITE